MQEPSLVHCHTYYVMYHLARGLSWPQLESPTPKDRAENVLGR